jgi:ATP-binding cassette subfamily B (MDR/TAP) protein 1
MAVILCVMFGSVGLGQFAADTSDKAEALNAAKAIRVLWDEEPSMDAMDETRGSVPAELHGKLEFRNVAFSYPMRPDHAVYKNLNLIVEAGETVAFVGPSGCGKSTAVALLERFYDPDGGAVSLDGTDLRDLRLSWLRAQIGLVSQEPVLFSGTIFDNIACGLVGDDGAASRGAVEDAAKLANAHEFITSFPGGYATEVGEKGVQLSGGQKQRIAIARAIVRDPSILILDEATSALDANSEKVVQAALDGLLQQKKRTTIIIAHRLSTIRNANKVSIMLSYISAVYELNILCLLFSPHA